MKAMMYMVTALWVIGALYASVAAIKERRKWHLLKRRLDLK